VPRNFAGTLNCAKDKDTAANTF